MCQTMCHGGSSLYTTQGASIMKRVQFSLALFELPGSTKPNISGRYPKAGYQQTTHQFIYLGVEQGCGRGFWQGRNFRDTQIERLIQMEKGANHTGPQTGHPVNTVGLETKRQVNIKPVVPVEERRKVGGKEIMLII